MPKGIPDIQHKSLYDLLDSLKTEDDCREFLEELRWNGTVICVRCGGLRISIHGKDKKGYKCNDCRKVFNIKTEAIFENSTIPFRKWLEVIKGFAISKKGLNSCEISRLVNIQQRSAWFMGQRIRKALEESDLVLEGMVEADETVLGPNLNLDQRLSVKIRRFNKKQEKLYDINPRKLAQQKYQANIKKNKIGIPRGRPKGSKNRKPEKKFATTYEYQTYVLGMVSRKTNTQPSKVIFRKLGRTKSVVNRATLHPILKKHISENATLITDANRSYNGIQKHFANYLRIIKDVKVEYKDKLGQTQTREYKRFTDGSTHVNTIEGTWKLLKRAQRNYVHYSDKHTELYLNEFAYIYNRSNEDPLGIFLDILDKALKTRITFKELTRDGKEKSEEMKKAG